MNCPICNLEARVTQGKPVTENGKTYWRQVFTCKNPQCPDYNKEIGVRKVNIFDNNEVIEE